MITPTLRIVLVHLNPLSARLHFWINQSPSGITVCQSDGTHPLSMVHQQQPDGVSVRLPNSDISELANRLAIDEQQLEVVTPNLCWIEMPREWLQVALVRVMTEELPELVPTGQFISIMDILDIPEHERIILRYGYEALLGD